MTCPCPALALALTLPCPCPCLGQGVQGQERRPRGRHRESTFYFKFMFFFFFKLTINKFIKRSSPSFHGLLPYFDWVTLRRFSKGEKFAWWGISFWFLSDKIEITALSLCFFNILRKLYLWWLLYKWDVVLIIMFQ